MIWGEVLRKLAVLAICIFILLCVWPGNLRAEDAKPVTKQITWEEAARRLDLQQMEKFKGQIDSEISSYLQDKSLSELLSDFMKGDFKLDPGEIGRNLLDYILREILASGHLLGKILVLAVISALLMNMQSSFSDEGVSKLSNWACFLALSAIALSSFKYVLSLGQSTINTLTDFMSGILPQMMILVTGLGHLNSAAAVFPLMMTTCTFFGNAMEWVVFPLIVISAVLSIINCLSDTVKVQKMAKLVSSMATWAMGLMLTVFVTFLTLNSIYGSVLDKVTLKTGKFVADKFFPVIGGYLSDALETAAGYVVLLKQAVGIFGVLIIFGLIIFPVLKIGVVAFIYKLAAALVEPLGDSKTSQVLEIMGDHLLMVLAAVAGVGLMFFILIAIIGSMGNSVIMLR